MKHIIQYYPTLPRLISVAKRNDPMQNGHSGRLLMIEITATATLGALWIMCRIVLRERRLMRETQRNETLRKALLPAGHLAGMDSPAAVRHAPVAANSPQRSVAALP